MLAQGRKIGIATDKVGVVVVGLGDDIRQAVEKTYKVVSKIKFEKMRYRKDIAHRALERNLEDTFVGTEVD